MRDFHSIKRGEKMVELKRGDRVEVFKNSERIRGYEYLNKFGTATGKRKARDFEISFDDGPVVYIFMADLRLVVDHLN